MDEKLLAELGTTNSILKGLIESVKDVIIFALDTQYRYLVFNKNHSQTMKKIWGVDIAVGENMFDYIKDPKDQIKAKTNFDRALSGESFIVEEEYGNVALGRRYYENNYNPLYNDSNAIIGLTLILTDVTIRRSLELERNRLISELQESLAKVKLLSGMLPVCSHCKKIRDDNGYWSQIESYIKEHSEAEFTHGICPDCAEKLYGHLHPK